MTSIRIKSSLASYHSISGGGFPSPSQQNATLWPGIRILLSGWTVTNGGTAEFNNIEKRIKLVYFLVWSPSYYV